MLHTGPDGQALTTPLLLPPALGLRAPLAQPSFASLTLQGEVFQSGTLESPSRNAAFLHPVTLRTVRLSSKVALSIISEYKAASFTSSADFLFGLSRIFSTPQSSHLSLRGGGERERETKPCHVFFLKAQNVFSVLFLATTTKKKLFPTHTRPFYFKPDTDVMHP